MVDQKPVHIKKMMCIDLTRLGLLMAFDGRGSPAPTHCADCRLSSGSKLLAHVSSPAMIRCKKSFPSRRKRRRWAAQIFIRSPSCSGVSTCGIHLAAILHLFNFSVRMVWMKEEQMPTWSANSANSLQCVTAVFFKECPDLSNVIFVTRSARTA